MHYDSCQDLLNQNDSIMFGLSGWVYTKFKIQNCTPFHFLYLCLRTVNKEIDAL